MVPTKPEHTHSCPEPDMHRLGRQLTRPARSALSQSALQVLGPMWWLFCGHSA